MVTDSILSYAAGTLVALFPIANPIGAVPMFYSLLGNDPPAYRRKQAQRITINVILILVLFLFGGRAILEFFGISLGVLRIAGGLLVAHTAWEMLTVKHRLSDSEHQAAADKEDISFTPMATPLIAGPGAIGVVIGLSARLTNSSEYIGSVVGITLLGALLYLCLRIGEVFLKALGRNGIGALNRILGFFILAIAVQFIADGTLTLLQKAAPTLFHLSFLYPMLKS